VTIRTASEPTGIKIEIEDSGEGIPVDALPRIFERFYRANPARDKVIDGVGLGLSLVKWIVEEHGGTITAVSRPGDGSCFTIVLPQD